MTASKEAAGLPREMGDPAFSSLKVSLLADYLINVPLQRKGKVRIMRTLARIFLLAVLILSFAVSTYAQEKLVIELYRKAGMVYRQGRHVGAARIAEEALTVAKKTFGPDHPAVGASLNILAMANES